MPIFEKIEMLCKQIASALLKEEEPTTLKQSDLFGQKDKDHILKNLIEDIHIKERLLLSNQIDQKEDWIKIEKRITVPVRTLYWRYAAAAVVVGVLASAYFFRGDIISFQEESLTPIIVNNQIEPGTDKAILTLENGEAVALEKGTTYQTQNATSNGKEIVYSATENSSSRELVFNYLTVPRGGQFYIKLSDGTRVWLNSETQLKYPVNFTAGETRQVELVYGEAYFEVSHSTENQGSHFKVHNNDQEVEVLGTKFNIKAYKDESHINTTLVEGKVVVSTENDRLILTPNLQSQLDRASHHIVLENVDAYAEMAWINGEFILHSKTLEEIMIVLSRWYDMDVTFDNKDLEDVKFVGILRKNQNIVDILNTIKSYQIIKDYEINNKHLILK